MVLKRKISPALLLGFLIILATSPTLATQPLTDNAESFQLPDLGAPLLLADARATPQENEPGAAPLAQCLAFAKDLDADLGEVLRAGCEPTLAQMSALMDNPVGNVAALFTQFDASRLLIVLGT